MNLVLARARERTKIMQFLNRRHMKTAPNGNGLVAYGAWRSRSRSCKAGKWSVEGTEENRLSRMRRWP